MDITGAASLTIQANSLDAVRTTLSAAQAAPPTPQAQAAVILQLSTAAQRLMQLWLGVSHPSVGASRPGERRLAPCRAAGGVGI